MEPEPSTPEELDALEGLIDGWAAEQLAENPTVDAVERDTESGDRRWFVRLLGEEKAVFTVWIWLRQRTLHLETYFMPAPEENEAQLYEQLLRRNDRLVGMHFSIGLEDAFHEQTILAYDMNDQALPIPHGAPLRLRVERQLGYKMAKYIMRIEAVADFGQIAGGRGGFWEDRGYEWYAGI